MGERTPSAVVHTSASPAQGKQSGLEVFDGFRSLAILGVVLLHILIVSGWLGGHDDALGVLAWGVLGNVIDIFFIASGFLLYLPAVRRSGELGRRGPWLLRRAARLLPAYWLTLAVVLVMLSVAPLPGTGIPSISAIGVHLGALQMPARMLDASMPAGLGLNGPVWMISVIAGLYLVLAFAAKPYFRHPLAGLFIAAGVVIAWKEAALHTGFFQAIAGETGPDWAVTLIAVDQLPAWVFSFALGMTGAWAYVSARERWPAPQLAAGATLALPFASAAYVAFALAYGREGASLSSPIAGSVVRSDVLLGIGSSLSRAILMGVIVIGPLWLRRPFANRVTAALAPLSYGVFLIHFVVISYAARYLGLPAPAGGLGVLAWILVVLPVSTLFALISLHFVERPALEWCATGNRTRCGFRSPFPRPACRRPLPNRQ